MGKFSFFKIGEAPLKKLIRTQQIEPKGIVERARIIFQKDFLVALKIFRSEDKNSLLHRARNHTVDRFGLSAVEEQLGPIL